MLDRPRKRLGKFVVDAATSTGDDERIKPSASDKSPAAVSLGRLGRLKGGKARAAKLGAKKRSEIARLAATARWKRDDS
jgi:hypothetical protein